MKTEQKVPRAGWGHGYLAVFFRLAVGLPSLAFLGLHLWFGLPEDRSFVEADFLSAFAAVGVVFLAAALLPSVYTPKARIRRDGDVVKGMGKRREFKAGRGNVVVRSVWKQGYLSRGSTSTRDRRFYEVHVEWPGEAICFCSHGVDPLKVRTLAEGLSRVGKIPLHWGSDSALSYEVRQPHQLDLPLVELLDEQTLPAPLPTRPQSERIELEVGDETATLRWIPPRASELRHSLLFSVGAGLILGIVGALEWGLVGYVGVSALMGASLFSILSFFWLRRRLVEHEIKSSPQGVERRRRFFKRIEKTDFFDALEIESVYLSGSYRVRLVLASDDFYVPIGGRLSGPEMVTAYTAIVRPLAGKSPVAESTEERSRESAAV